MRNRALPVGDNAEILPRADFKKVFPLVLPSPNSRGTDCAPVVSDVPQGTVLGPLLFSLHINDITADIESEIRLFADDCVCYREIKDKEDTLKLQRDIDRLGNWARKWGMRFQPVKCNMMQLTINI